MNDNWKPIVQRKPVRLAVIEGGVPPKPEPCSCGCRGVGVDAAHVPGAKIGPFFSFCRSCGTEGPAATNYDCQSARNIDPGSASKTDPSFALPGG
jgi:hypothetical protein